MGKKTVDVLWSFNVSENNVSGISCVLRTFQDIFRTLDTFGTSITLALNVLISSQGLLLDVQDFLLTRRRLEDKNSLKIKS